MGKVSQVRWRARCLSVPTHSNLDLSLGYAVSDARHPGSLARYLMGFLLCQKRRQYGHRRQGSVSLKLKGLSTIVWGIVIILVIVLVVVVMLQ